MLHVEIEKRHMNVNYKMTKYILHLWNVDIGR